MEHYAETHLKLELLFNSSITSFTVSCWNMTSLPHIKILYPLTISVNLTLSDKLNDAYAKFYNPSKFLAMQEVTVLFRGTKYLRNINAFMWRITNCDTSGYTYHMIGRKQTKCNTDYYGHHAKVQSLIKGVKKGHHKFTWTISFPLQIYLNTCMQELTIPTSL